MLREQSLNLILLLFGLLGGLGLGWFAVVSIQEREKRAARVAVILAITQTIIFYLATYFALNIKIAILYILITVLVLALGFFFLPIRKVPPDTKHPTRQFDERMIMFSRHRLEPGSPEYVQYYSLHPEHQTVDDRTRARPGLLSPTSKHANPKAYAATDASFQLTDAMHQMVEGQPAKDQHPISPEDATRFLKGLAIHFGAETVGMTILKPYHVYSHIGRGPGQYGGLIDLEHQYAIAFTVEMDHKMMQAAPQGSVVMESAHQYVEAGKIAVQLAGSIRALGYEARAHMDANYRVICPPVARDAGLGEIGRITLLMTPNLGPRVRLGVVTTNLPLKTDIAKPDPSMIDFCQICKKCAENCPSKSIPFGPRHEADGVLRWQINPETCFAYWNEIGTDCGICMAVCPYSHPDQFLHNLVRWGNARSGAFRRFALWLDDLFYGRHPNNKAIPDWLLD